MKHLNLISLLVLALLVLVVLVVMNRNQRRENFAMSTDGECPADLQIFSSAQKLYPITTKLVNRVARQVRQSVGVNPSVWNGTVVLGIAPGGPGCWHGTTIVLTLSQPAMMKMEQLLRAKKQAKPQIMQMMKSSIMWMLAGKSLAA